MKIYVSVSNNLVVCEKNTMVVFKYCGNKQRKRDFIIVDKQPITQELFEECVEYMFPKAFVTEVQGYIKNNQLVLSYSYVTENENIKPIFIYSKVK